MLPLLKFHTVTVPLFVAITSRRWFLSKLMAVTQFWLVLQGPQVSSGLSLSAAALTAEQALKRPSRAPSCNSNTLCCQQAVSATDRLHVTFSSLQAGLLVFMHAVCSWHTATKS
jgi:hypothetical protein